MRYSGTDTAVLLKTTYSNIRRSIRQARADGIDVPGIIPTERGDQYTDEFLDWYKVPPGTSRKRLAQQAAAHTVEVTGLTPADRIPNPTHIWEEVLRIQHSAERQVERRYSQRITIPVGGDGREPCRLLLVNGGNHEERTPNIAGIDVLRELLHNITTLYDPNEILFALSYGDYEQLWKCRHSWKYNSVMNPFHSFMRDLERTDDWDVAVGGHVHSGSHYARWDHPSRELGGPALRYALLIGTYEYHSKYGVQCNFARHTGSGSITMCLAPDGNQWLFDTVQAAASFLTWARSYYPIDLWPVGIALLSDLHLGNTYCDYRQIRADVTSIITTPGLYAAILGDCYDNWVGPLERIQRMQPISHQAEVSLLRSVLGALTGNEEYLGEFR